jgi:hypothetical protein
MRAGALVCLLLLGCTEALAPKLDQNAKQVEAIPDPPPVFAPPQTPGPLRTEPVPDRVRLAPIHVPLVTHPTLTTEPAAATQISELRVVRVALEVFGADPSEVAVEFTAPTGEIFERQATQLTGTRFDHQTAEFALPVAGTLIEQLEMVGTWQARFFLRGVENSWLSFEVTP